MVNVRFVCIPGVSDVKCTLDGVIKYSDSSGFANFYDISIGDHTYSAEKEGWQFVSGYAPFMGSIPQSGTVTIPAGWSADIPFALELVFEEISAGEFRFDSWNPPFDTRELFSTKAVWPYETASYDVGEDAYVHYVVKNIGFEAGKAIIEVKDLDTGAIITTWSIPELAPNNRFKTSGSGAYIGKMPSKDWRLEFKVKP